MSLKKKVRNCVTMCLYCNFTMSKDAMPSAAVKDNFSQRWPGTDHSNSTGGSGSTAKRLVTCRCCHKNL